MVTEKVYKSKQRTRTQEWCHPALLPEIHVPIMPSHSSLVELEQLYWKEVTEDKAPSVTIRAEVQATLTDASQAVLNMASLSSIISGNASINHIVLKRLFFLLKRRPLRVAYPGSLWGCGRQHPAGRWRTWTCMQSTSSTLEHPRHGTVFLLSLATSWSRLLRSFSLGKLCLVSTF